MALYRVFTQNSNEETSIEIDANSFKSAIRQGETWAPGNTVTALWKWIEKERTWKSVDIEWSMQTGRAWVASWSIA